MFLPKPTEANQSRAGAAEMTAEERRLLPPNERRTLHRGRHDGALARDIQFEMDNIVRAGRPGDWQKNQYQSELIALISAHREQLRQGVVALNKHKRDWVGSSQSKGNR